MQKSEILAILGERLGDRDDLGADAVSEMDYVQRFELEQNDWLPWFLDQGDRADLVISGAGNGTITLPDDYLLSIEDEPLWIQLTNGKWKELPRGGANRLEALYNNTDPTLPVGYALRGQELQLYPAPDQVYTLRWRFFAQDELPSVATENLWMKYAGDLLLNATGKRIAQQTQDDRNFQLFDTDLLASWNRLYTKHIARMEEGRVRIMGDM